MILETVIGRARMERVKPIGVINTIMLRIFDDIRSGRLPYPR